MAAVTIVRHTGTDPNTTFAQILNAPVLAEAQRQSFKIRCASLDSIEADIKGKRFIFDSKNLPTGGKVLGIVLYEDGAIASQYINCDFAVKRLSALILSTTPIEGDQVLPALGIQSADFVFIR